jgi:hypothetical protein
MLSTYTNKLGDLKPWMSFVVADGGVNVRSVEIKLGKIE